MKQMVKAILAFGFCVACSGVLPAAVQKGLYEAKSEFTIDSPGARSREELAELVNTRLSEWRSEVVVMKILQQYRLQNPNSLVTDRDLIETLANSRLELVPRSRLVTIAVRSTSPELAAALANIYAQTIESYTDEENLKRCDRAVAFVHETVEKQRRADDALAGRLIKFRMENKLDNLMSERDIIKQSLTAAVADVLIYEGRVTTAQEWVKVLETAQKNPEKYGELPTDVSRTTEIAAAYTKFLAVKKELAALKTSFTQAHPAVQAKEAEFKAALCGLTDTVKRAYTTALSDLAFNESQLAQFKRKVDALKKEIDVLGQKIVQADAGQKQLEQEKRVSSDVYQDLLRKENEVRIAAEQNNDIVRVGRPAQIPTKPLE